MRCDYEVIVQDPACNTPPCGLELIAHGSTKATADPCGPLPVPATLMNIMVGDKVDVQGVVDTFGMNPPGDAGVPTAAITQHEVEVDTVTKNGTGTITATVLTDGSKFHTFASDAQWQTYEGMLIKLQPVGGLTVTKVDTAVPFHFYTDPGTTDWGTDYRFLYYADAGTTFPTGRNFSAIQGVVKMAFGGAIHARFMSDFTP
jgi:hypothetical protein